MFVIFYAKGLQTVKQQSRVIWNIFYFYFNIHYKVLENQKLFFGTVSKSVLVNRWNDFFVFQLVGYINFLNSDLIVYSNIWILFYIRPNWNYLSASQFFVYVDFINLDSNDHVPNDYAGIDTIFTLMRLGWPTPSPPQFNISRSNIITI